MFRPSALLTRLVFLLPFVMAMGVWLGHQTLASDLIEHHSDYPIKLSTFLAPVPECPEPEVKRAPRPVEIIPVALPADPLPEVLLLPQNESRGPPTPAV